MKVYQTDLFPFNLAVMRTSEFADWKKEFYTTELEEFSLPDENALGVETPAIRVDREHKTNSFYVLVVFPQKPATKTIAHESFHAACDLLEKIGINYQHYSSNESYAYTIEWVYSCIEDALKTDAVWA